MDLNDQPNIRSLTQQINELKAALDAATTEEERPRLRYKRFLLKEWRLGLMYAATGDEILA